MGVLSSSLGMGQNCVCVMGQVEASVVDEPQVIVFRGSFKLAPEPRGVARSAALAAAEMVLVSPLMSVSLSVSLSVWLHCLHVLYTSTTRTISGFVSIWHHSCRPVWLHCLHVVYTSTSRGRGRIAAGLSSLF